MAEPRRCPKTGTGRATIANTSCCVVAFRLSPAKATWGGARNRANRSSDALADHKVESLLDAARFALATGRTFQRHWIVHYGRAGIAEHQAAGFLRKLFEQVRKKRLSPDEAVERLRHLPFEDLGFAKIDHHRALRQGMPEVIFAQGKTPRQVAQTLPPAVA